VDLHHVDGLGSLGCCIGSPSGNKLGNRVWLESIMLRFGMYKRVERAILPQLDAGERLEASALCYVPGKGDFAIGRTGTRIVWVGVTKLTGRANGKVFSDDIQKICVGRERFSHTPILRSDGSVVKVRIDRGWEGRIAAVVSGLASADF
jgi:hypothetical protein